MKILLLRPYYGVNIHADMAGDIGVVEHKDLIFPDLSLFHAYILAKSLKLDVELMDANSEKLLPEALLEKINSSYNEIIIKATGPSLKYDLELIACIKKMYPKTKVVIGGGIIKVFHEWIAANTRHTGMVLASKIDDYIYEIATGRKTQIELDDLPLIDYSMLPNVYHHFMKKPVSFLYSSRGCKMKCAYCPYHHYSYEEKNLDKLCNEISIILNLGIKTIQFRDQFFTWNRERVLRFCSIIKERGWNFNWMCETTISTLDYQLIDIMKEAGLTMLMFGVESASDNIKKKYNRPVIKTEQLKNTIQYLHNNGIKTYGFYIYGFPDDDWNTINATYDLACEMDTTFVEFNLWIPYPGTRSAESFESNNSPPDYFSPLYNLSNVNACKNFSNFDLIDLRRQLLFMYLAKRQGLVVAFQDFRQQLQSVTQAAENLSSVQSFLNRLNPKPVSNML